MDKKYFAFISYKHEDEKFAKWLQDKLGYYRFPTNLNGNADLPKRINPIFRDVTDTKPGPLSEQIESALNDSQWLIVVCSPRSAKSVWVCKESQYFIDNGRADYIIPFIIDGTPFSRDEKTECYPEALLNLTGERELLGANINEMGRNAAVVKVVARMFNLEFDALWQRYNRQQRMKRIGWGIVVLLFLLFLMTVGHFFYLLDMKQVNTAREKEKVEVDLHKTRLTNLLESAQTECEKGNLAKALRMSLYLLNDSLSSEECILAAENVLRKCDIPVHEDPYSKLILDSICDCYFSYAFTPDGKYLLTNSGNNVFKWDTKTGKCLIKSSLHNKEISSIAISKSGDYFLTTSRDSTLRVWYTDTFEPKTSQMKHNDVVYNAVFCPHDQRILSRVKSNEVCVWDIETGNQIIQPIGFEGNVRYIAWSPDGYSFATTFDVQRGLDELYAFVRVWNSGTGELINELKGHSNSINSVDYSPDGRYIVTASKDNTARAWDAKTGEPVFEPFVHDNDVYSAVFSPNGKQILTVSSDFTARVWDAITGEPLIEPLRHESMVWNAVFSPDGKYIVTASSDNTARVWDAITGEPVTEPLRHDNCVFSAVFSPVNRDVFTLVFDDSGYCGCLWNLSLGKSAEYLEHNKRIAKAQYSSDGHYILTEDLNAVCVWDAESFDKRMYIINRNGILTANFSPDEKYIITVNRDSTVSVWDRFSGELAIEPLKHDGLVYAAEYTPDGENILTLSNDSTVRIWNVKSGELAIEPLKHDCFVFVAKYSPDGKNILTVSYDSKVRIWNAKSGELAIEPLKHDGLVNAAEYSPDGKNILTRSSGNTAYIWDLEKGKQVTEKPLQHNGYVGSATFSPDGKYLVTTSSDSAAYIWEVMTGKLVTEPLRHNNKVMSAVFSPDGKNILTRSSGNTAYIWDLEKGKQVTEKPLQHNGYVESATFSPDGKYLVTTSSDSAAYIWEVMTGKLVTEPLRHYDRVNTAVFSPDGNYILTASNDKMANVWRVCNGERVVRKLRHPISHDFLNDDINSVIMSEDERYILTTSNNGTIVIWDAKTFGIVDSYYLMDMSSAVFSKNNEYVLAVDDSGFCVSLRNNIDKTLVFSKEIKKKITSAFFSPDGKNILTVFGNDSIVSVWDLNMETLVLGPLEHDGDINSASYNHDGKYIVTTSSNGIVTVWDAETGTIYKELRNEAWEFSYSKFCSAVFSSDGNKLMIARTDGDVYVMDTNEWKESIYIDEEYNLKSAVFSNDGKYILVAANSTIRVLDAENGKSVYEKEFYSKIKTAVFSPKDNYILVTEDAEEYISVWPFPPLQELLDKYNNDPEHDWSLSDEEKEEYGLE